MLMIKRKKLILTALIVLLSVVVFGGWLSVNLGNGPLAQGGQAWAAGSFGARPGVGTSAGVGGGAVGVGPGAPGRGAPGVGAPGPGVGTSAGVGGGAVGVGPGAPARGAAGTPVAGPRGFIR